MNRSEPATGPSQRCFFSLCAQAVHPPHPVGLLCPAPLTTYPQGGTTTRPDKSGPFNTRGHHQGSRHDCLLFAGAALCVAYPTNHIGRSGRGGGYGLGDLGSCPGPSMHLPHTQPGTLACSSPAPDSSRPANVHISTLSQLPQGLDHHASPCSINQSPASSAADPETHRVLHDVDFGIPALGAEIFGASPTAPPTPMLLLRGLNPPHHRTFARGCCGRIGPQSIHAIVPGTRRIGRFGWCSRCPKLLPTAFVAIGLLGHFRSDHSSSP